MRLSSTSFPCTFVAASTCVSPMCRSAISPGASGRLTQRESDPFLSNVIWLGFLATLGRILSRYRGLTLTGLAIFCAGFLSALVGVATFPPADFPPWAGAATGSLLAWGWMTVGAVAIGGILAIVGSVLDNRVVESGPLERSSVATATAVWGLRPVIVIFVVVIVLATAGSTVLGDPEFLGLNCIRWGAFGILLLGAGWVAASRVRARQRHVAPPRVAAP